MNWDAIAAGAEILAAVAVVVSVLYLAQQIRQSTVASTAAVNQGISDSFRGVNELIAGSPDLADILVRGAESVAQLCPGEALRFSSAMTNFFNILEHQHRQFVISGRFDDKAAQEMAAVVLKRLALPGIADWWQQNTDDFSDEFVRWVESIRAAA